MVNEKIPEFRGLWIPREIWLDESLTTMERMFYSCVNGLSGRNGCYAGNPYFVTLFQVSTSRVSQLVKSLNNKKYISVKLFYKKGTKQVIKREIYPIKIYSKKLKNSLSLDDIKNIDPNKHHFKGVWIPREIWFDSNINKLEMVLLIEIDSLSGSDYGCFASNSHFAKFLNISSSRVSQMIKDLKSKNYIDTTLFHNPKNKKQVIKREIYLLNKLNGVLNLVADPIKFTKKGYLEKCKEIVPGSYNHIYINTVSESDNIPYSEIVDYLNNRTHKSFKYESTLTRKFISDRWNDGFRVSDFKKVIDHQVSRWLNDPDRNIYLRPKTLFGPNFEDYLNSKPASTKNRKVEEASNFEEVRKRLNQPLPTHEECVKTQKEIEEQLTKIRKSHTLKNDEK